MNLAELTKKLEDFAKNELKALNIRVDCMESDITSDLPFNNIDTKKFPHHKGEKYIKQNTSFHLSGVL